jgi:hypothetical protein
MVDRAEILINDGMQVAFFGFQDSTETVFPRGALSGSASVVGMAAASYGAVLGIVLQQGAELTTHSVNTNDGSELGAAQSFTGEQPLGPVAAANCGTGFGYAYAVDGGNVLFREMGLDGTPLGTSSLIANLGGNARSIGLAATDAGLVLAVGTPDQIAVYSLACH